MNVGLMWEVEWVGYPLFLYVKYLRMWANSDVKQRALLAMVGVKCGIWVETVGFVVLVVEYGTVGLAMLAVEDEKVPNEERLTTMKTPTEPWSWWMIELWAMESSSIVLEFGSNQIC